MEVAPQVWRVFSGDPIPEEVPDYQEAMWTGVGPMIRQTMDENPLWRVYSSREEDFGEPLTPRRIRIYQWRARAWAAIPWIGLSALVAALALSAIMVRQYGRLLP